jgi:hypothetical protein
MLSPADPARPSQVITHAVLELCYGYAGMYVQFTVPAPPVANAKVRERVSRMSGFRGLISTMCCCFCPRPVRKAVDLDATRTLVDLERDNEDSMLWRVHRVQTARKLTSAFFQLLIWLAIVIALVFLFIAQFSWFPWPDDKPQGDPTRTLIGGKRPLDFFRECAAHRHCVPVQSMLVCCPPGFGYDCPQGATVACRCTNAGGGLPRCRFAAPLSFTCNSIVVRLSACLPRAACGPTSPPSTALCSSPCGC